MSEGLAHGARAPAPSRSQPAYGEGRLTHEEPKVEERVDVRTELALMLAIFVPVIAAYGAVGYAVYRAASALI